MSIYRFEWRDDWEVGSHVKEYGEAYDDEPTTCEVALLYVTQPCGHEELVDSLGCVDDADTDYRQSIERDLLGEYRLAHPINDTLAASADAIARTERIAGLS